MAKYEIYNPEAAFLGNNVLGDAERTKLKDLPDLTRLKVDIKKMVLDAIGATDITARYADSIGWEKVLEIPLNQFDGIIDIGKIMDTWAAAATFDPERIRLSATKAAWIVQLADGRQGAMVARLVNNFLSPVGKSWQFEAFRWDETTEGWELNEDFMFACDAEHGGHYLKSPAEIGKYLKGGPVGLVEMNLSAIVGTSSIATAQVVRIPEFIWSNYASKEKKLDELWIEGCERLDWEKLDKPSLPIMIDRLKGNEEIFNKGGSIRCKAGQYDVELEYAKGAPYTYYGKDIGADHLTIRLYDEYGTSRYENSSELGHEVHAEDVINEAEKLVNELYHENWIIGGDSGQSLFEDFVNERGRSFHSLEEALNPTQTAISEIGTMMAPPNQGRGKTAAFPSIDDFPTKENLMVWRDLERNDWVELATGEDGCWSCESKIGEMTPIITYGENAEEALKNNMKAVNAYRGINSKPPVEVLAADKKDVEKELVETMGETRPAQAATPPMAQMQLPANRAKTAR